MSNEDADSTRLMEWLADKPEDVWFDLVDRINWDDAWPLIDIIDHPNCTKPLAARIFWAAGPEYLAETLYAGGAVDPNADGDIIIETVLKNWRAGLYRDGEIAFDGPVKSYRAMLERNAPKPDPLNVPADLLQTFEGRMPVVDPEFTPEFNADVWDLYSDQLLAVDARPGSAKYRAPPLPYRTGYELERMSDDERRAIEKAAPRQWVNPDPVARRFGAIMTFVMLGVLAALIYWRWLK